MQKINGLTWIIVLKALWTSLLSRTSEAPGHLYAFCADAYDIHNHISNTNDIVIEYAQEEKRFMGRGRTPSP